MKLFRRTKIKSEESIQSVNFKGKKKLFRKKRGKKKLKRRIILGLILIVLAVGSYLGYKAYTAMEKAFAGNNDLIGLLDGQSTPLKGQDRGRTNILVYGMTKDGLRTDSIILTSYYWKEKKLVTLNIPRDLYFYDGYENDKIGEVYAYALNRKHGDQNYAMQFVSDLISKEYNIPIDYRVKVNMQGEVNFINTIGGIDVNAPDSFTDYEFPTWDYSGYIRPAPHFDAGMQHMNGDTALIYSRSRHSMDNNEGSDFARSKRQALVIQAIMNKVKSMGLVGNVADVTHYLDILGDNVHTDMSVNEMVSFAKTLKEIDPQRDYVRASWESDNGFLCATSNYEGSYIVKYGTQDDCIVGGGGYKNSKYRDMARYFVQNMLVSAPQAPADFVKSATIALGSSQEKSTQQ